MAQLMPCLVGALACLACWEALWCMQHHAPAAGVRAHGPADAALGALAGVGAFALRRVPAANVLGRYAQELAEMLRPRWQASGNEAALGLLITASVACALAGGIIAMSPVGAFAGLAAPCAVCAGRISRARRERQRALETAMPEAFGALAISLGSGHSLAQALRFVGNHAQEPVKSEFMKVSCSIACGVPAAEALDAMIEHLKAPGLDLVALALKVSQRTGAPLKDMLGEASRMVGERIELERRLEVKTAQARMSARMVALMPIAMIGVLTLISPDFRDGLASTTGTVSVGIALVLNLMAWMAIRKIMEVRL